MSGERHVDLPPPIIRKELPFKQVSLVWEPGKGWRVERKPFVFEFPPPLLTLHFRKEKRE